MDISSEVMKMIDYVIENNSHVKEPDRIIEWLSTEEELQRTARIILRINGSLVDISYGLSNDDAFAIVREHITCPNEYIKGMENLSRYIDKYKKYIMDVFERYQPNLYVLDKEFVFGELKKWFLKEYDRIGFLDNACDPMSQVWLDEKDDIMYHISAELRDKLELNKNIWSGY